MAIKRQRLQEDEVLQSIWKKGIRSFDEVEAITPEGDRTVAVMEKGNNYDNEALEDVIWLEK